MPAPSGNDLTLLGLPTEMIQHISNVTSEEALLMLRLTHRHLEATSHSQFIERLDIVCQHCWMPSKQRWCRLHNILNSRLGQHIKRVALMAGVIDHISARDIPVVVSQQLSNMGLFHEQLNARYFISDEQSRGLEAPSYSMVTETLQIIARQNIELSLYFDSETQTPPACMQFLLSTIATTNTPIKGLTLNQLDCFYLDPMFAFYNKEFLKAIGTIETFEFCATTQYNQFDGFCAGQGGGPGLDNAILVLRSAIHLKNLWLNLTNLNDMSDADLSAQKSATDMLLANDLSSLRSLTLSAFTIRCEYVLEALSHCKDTLTEIDFDDVALIGPDTAWTQIWEHLATMEGLETLSFGNPMVADGNDYRQITLGEGHDHHFSSQSNKVQGQAAVQAELKRMLALSHQFLP